MTAPDTAIVEARKALETAATGTYTDAAAQLAAKRRAALTLATVLLAGHGAAPGIVTTPGDSAADKIAAAILEKGAEAPAEIRKIITDLWESGALTEAEKGALADGPPDAPPVVFLSGLTRNDPIPAPILWRDADGHEDPFWDPDNIVSEGQIAVLAGAGGGGKSWLAIRLAVEAAAAAEKDMGYGAACGLRIAPGPVVILSYEMTAREIDLVAERMGSAHGVPVLPPQGPLFPLDAGSRAHMPGPSWRAMWKALAYAKPRLIIIDTGPKSMGGIADANAPGPVIAFCKAIEAELGDIPGAAALVICHDTKAVRDAASVGEDIGAGAAAGSGQWYDSPRGMIHIGKVRGTDTRMLECVKASYGRDGWGARLEPLYVNPETRRSGGYRYAGLQLTGRIAPGGMLQARKAAAKEAADEAEAAATTSRMTDGDV